VKRRADNAAARDVAIEYSPGITPTRKEQGMNEEPVGERRQLGSVSNELSQMERRVDDAIDRVDALIARFGGAS
jgi:hypothetical protein